MHELMKKIRDDNKIFFVNVWGEKGVGTTTLVRAVAHYMIVRRM
jgi:hypothetical protein